MFTGIVEERGEVVDLRVTAENDDTAEPGASPGSARLTVRGPLVTQDAGHGDSISVSGVCLTVVDRSADTFTVDVMAETLKRSTIGTLEPGDRVNLERSVTAATRLGGHIVQGHVDGVGVLEQIKPDRQWILYRFRAPAPVVPYLVEKGSIALDGVSLTVASLDAGRFGVALIPHTLEVTTLGGVREGDRLNVEVDLLGKDVHRALQLRGLA